LTTKFSMDSLNIFLNSLWGTINWTINSILFQVPWYTNYFWGLIVISLVVWSLEVLFPWRKEQKFFRKDFWLDGFYMFFNFFLFSIAISGIYDLLQHLFFSVGLNPKSFTLVNLSDFPLLIQLLGIFCDFGFSSMGYSYSLA